MIDQSRWNEAKIIDISSQKKLDWVPKTNLSQGIDEAIKFCKKKYGI